MKGYPQLDVNHGYQADRFVVALVVVYRDRDNAIYRILPEVAHSRQLDVVVVGALNPHSTERSG